LAKANAAFTIADWCNSQSAYFISGGDELNYQEYRQSLNCKLTDKVEQELATFREETLSKSPKEIYEAAYQISLKSDIAECFSETDFSPQAVKALMKSTNLLDDIYQEWLETDYSHMEDLRQTVSDLRAIWLDGKDIVWEREVIYLNEKKLTAMCSSTLR
jgi:hypothetical protein